MEDLMDFGEMEFEDTDLSFFGDEPMLGFSDKEILKSSSQLRPFPLPAHLLPTSMDPMLDIDDEVLMCAPPQLIAHIQRTVAQGGMQVVSPRQVPFSKLMCRISGVKRALGDHVVGSIASADLTWPTIDGTDMSALLPDEPLKAVDPSTSIREKTRVEPLTRASHLLKDPILSCLVKGRVVIDILARNDVAGGWHEMAEVLAAAWGIKAEDLLDMDAFTLGFEGPLLRHAIQADDVYPTTYAPIHQRKCVSVGAVDASRAHLPNDSALDWRRMRTYCEAILLLACGIEGIPLHKAVAFPAPGDPSAPIGRPNTLAFRIAPCTVWTFETRTFSICPQGRLGTSALGGIPTEVLEALARYARICKPVSHAMSSGIRARTRQSEVVTPAPPAGESIRASYSLLVGSMRTGNLRGRMASATLRNMVYDLVDSAPNAERMRIVRYMHISNEEVKVHLKRTIVPDSMVDMLALRFQALGDHVRNKIAREAANRGSTIAEWWDDITSQVPLRYQALSEGTVGWSKVAVWLAFRSPTEKWSKLVSACHMNALRRADLSSVGSVSLPSELGSVDRLLEACRKAAKSLTTTYAAYYSGVADVAHAIALEKLSLGDERGHDVMKEAAYLWTLRARALRGTNVCVIEKGTTPKSPHHFLIPSVKVEVVVVPAPYKAFLAYKEHALNSSLVTTYSKTMLRRPVEGQVSHIFKDMVREICSAPDSVTTRYLNHPSQLGYDMESAWSDLVSDMTEVVRMYEGGAGQKSKTCRRTEEVVELSENIVIEQFKRRKTDDGEVVTLDFYEAYARCPGDQVDFIDDFMVSLDEARTSDLYSRRYTDEHHLIREVLKMEKEVEASASGNLETVR